MPVTRLHEASTIEIMRLFRDLLAGCLMRPVLSDEGEKVARDLGAHAPAKRGKRRTRPFGVTLREQGQVEQPLAGIIDDADCQARWVARDLAQKPAQGIGRHEADLEPDLADVGGALRPVRQVAGHFLDVDAIRKSRQPKRLGGFEVGRQQPALADHIEERHPVRIVQ